MTQPGNILPHNPLTTVGVLDELKRLKGEKPWIHFELELLHSQYPDNVVFKTALERLTTTTKTPVPAATKTKTVSKKD